MKRPKCIIDDGFRPDLVEGASFDGIFEIPHVPGPKEFIIPDIMVPFTKRKHHTSKKEFLVFYEHDIKFRDILTSTDDYLDELRNFSGVVNPDCSLYRDMPLTLQIANTYMSRAVGFKLWKEGLYSVPNIRWSDERSYTTTLFPEPFAFQGVDKNSIVSIGTYGCIRGAENTAHFKAGLSAMLEYLKPTIVLVYGPMPDNIFKPLITKTNFVRFDDWTTTKKRDAFLTRLKDSPLYENGELIGYETYSNLSM